MYNLVLLQKASQHYEIRCTLRRNTAAILRIFSRMRSFIARHIPYWRSRAQIGFDLAFHFVDMRYGYEITVDEHVMIYKYRNLISTFVWINTWWYIHVATLYQLFVRWTRDDIFRAQLYINFPVGEYVINTCHNFTSPFLYNIVSVRFFCFDYSGCISKVIFLVKI